jgi:hypothetical protein
MPAVAQNTIEPPWQITPAPEILQVGGELTANACEQLLEQPLESVIVTLYKPAVLMVMHCVLALNPPGPPHE